MDGVGLSFEDRQMLLEFLRLLDCWIKLSTASVALEKEFFFFFLQSFSSPMIPETSKVDIGTINSSQAPERS